MRISVVSFTEQGKQLAERIKSSCPEKEIEHCQKPKQGISQWAKEQFAEQKGMIFIGACGIAVRAIAPHLKDKLSDSPVLVLDEKGRYVIPILSGHVGGANALAELIAERIGAEAVLTTATDINGKFAIDVFARENNLQILNKEGIAKVSAKLLQGESIKIAVEDKENRIEDEENGPPEEVKIRPYPPQEKVDVLISSDAQNTDEEKKEGLEQQALLRLKPKEYVIGIGCKKGKSKEEIAEFIQRNLEKAGIKIADISAIASIDLKKKEIGICRWAEENRIPFYTFSEEELRKVEGTFHASSFVKQVVGVDNVCERAAMAVCGKEGELILQKQAENGMTMAVAKRKWKLKWKNTGK